MWKSQAKRQPGPMRARSFEAATSSCSRRQTALALALLLWAASASGLRFREDGTFKVVQFTDLHLGESPSKDEHTSRAMRSILRTEPDVDLVVVSGDLVSGWLSQGQAHWVEELWPKAVAPMLEANIPYAVALGNHDDEANLDRQQLVQLDMQQQPLSQTQLGPPGLPGASNYILSIYPSKKAAAHTSSSSQNGSSSIAPTKEDAAGAGMSNCNEAAEESPATIGSGSSSSSSSQVCSNSGGSGEQEAAAAQIWLLDSPFLICDGTETGAGCCEEQVPVWMQQASSPGIPSLAFVHIPLPEHMLLWEDFATRGSKREPVCCGYQSTCLFQALKAAGITAVWSGHDHDNSYYGSYQGIRLGYGQKTGYGSYGPPKGQMKGARVLLLREGQHPGEGETWIRYEGGSRKQQGPSAKLPTWLRRLGWITGSAAQRRCKME